MANSGRNETSMARGQKLCEDYGKDISDWNASKSAEQGKKLAGSTDNLSHSLSGARAQQHVD
jgi:hypothetical protein